jgi:hypothetical protein
MVSAPKRKSIEGARPLTDDRDPIKVPTNVRAVTSAEIGPANIVAHAGDGGTTTTIEERPSDGPRTWSTREAPRAERPCAVRSTLRLWEMLGLSVDEGPLSLAWLTRPI